MQFNFLFGFIACSHLIAILLFANGFFLTRYAMKLKSCTKKGTA